MSGYLQVWLLTAIYIITSLLYMHSFMPSYVVWCNDQLFSRSKQGEAVCSFDPCSFASVRQFIIYSLIKAGVACHTICHYSCVIVYAICIVLTASTATILPSKYPKL